MKTTRVVIGGLLLILLAFTGAASAHHLDTAGCAVNLTPSSSCHGGKCFVNSGNCDQGDCFVNIPLNSNDACYQATCTVNLGQCDTGGSCTLNVNLCYGGGACIANLGICDGGASAPAVDPIGEVACLATTAVAACAAPACAVRAPLCW